MVLSPHTVLFAICTVWGQRWNHPIACADSAPTTKSVGLSDFQNTLLASCAWGPFHYDPQTLSTPGWPDERLQHGQELRHLGGGRDGVVGRRMMTLEAHDDPQTCGTKRLEGVF